ncbi:Hypothetical_protein [Hexamita inflata]|uniref:Hypothetical_protein n=1 Tax=Hexamita inflata TaxID=28002 RepID=A0ABP1LWI3_9EUKA
MNIISWPPLFGPLISLLLLSRSQQVDNYQKNKRTLLFQLQVYKNFSFIQSSNQYIQDQIYNVITINGEHSGIWSLNQKKSTNIILMQTIFCCKQTKQHTITPVLGKYSLERSLQLVFILNMHPHVGLLLSLLEVENYMIQ